MGRAWAQAYTVSCWQAQAFSCICKPAQSGHLCPAQGHRRHSRQGQEEGTEYTPQGRSHPGLEGSMADSALERPQGLPQRLQPSLEEDLGI